MSDRFAAISVLDSVNKNFLAIWNVQFATILAQPQGLTADLRLIRFLTRSNGSKVEKVASQTLACCFRSDVVELQ